MIYGGQEVGTPYRIPFPFTSKKIDWTLNHSDFEFNMNITAQFSSDDGDTNLSTGLRDKIPAYVNGELRGVGEIEFIPALNRYAAFINVAGNISGANGSFIEAEDFKINFSSQKINITDNGKTSQATRLKKDNWIAFDLYATKAGTFDVEFRLASDKPGNVDLLIDDVLKRTITVPNTGNVNTYTTLKTTINMTQGAHRIKILSKDAEFDLNWFNFPEYHVRNKYNEEVIKFRMWDGLNGI